MPLIVGALLNNWLELRSDAFKIATLGRRPIPSRTDTIGAWLESLVLYCSCVHPTYPADLSVLAQSFITWLGALANAALVFLFNPQTGTFATGTSQVLNAKHTNILNATNAGAFPSAAEEPHIPLTSNGSLHPSGTPVMLAALLIALASSHGYLVVRVVVRHILERVLWKGSAEEGLVARAEMDVKDAWLAEHAEKKVEAFNLSNLYGEAGSGTFWVDEGLSLIQNTGKML